MAAEAARECIEEHEKSDIREQLKSGQQPWGSNRMSGIDWGDVASIIQECCNPIPTLRPPAIFIAQRLLDVYTQHCASSDIPLASSSSSQDHEKLRDAKTRCQALVQHIRTSKTKNAGLDKLSVVDFQILLEGNQEIFDPITSYLIGAAIWWNICDLSDLTDELTEAYDMRPEGFPT